MRNNLMAWVKGATSWVRGRLAWGPSRRELEDGIGHLALHAFYLALEEIDSLKGQLEAERKKRLDALAAQQASAALRLALDCAVAEFVDTFDDELLALHEATRLSKEEVSALIHLMVAAGRPEAGEIWEKHHKRGDKAEDIEGEMELAL
ncbi:hypothetical protein ACH5AU_30740 [Streptomyces albidoflavus]